MNQRPEAYLYQTTREEREADAAQDARTAFQPFLHTVAVPLFQRLDQVLGKGAVVTEETYSSIPERRSIFRMFDFRPDAYQPAAALTASWLDTRPNRRTPHNRYGVYLAMDPRTLTLATFGHQVIERMPVNDPRRQQVLAMYIEECLRGGTRHLFDAYYRE